MTSNDPIIIIGAGHNGLTAAAYLAKAGRSVLVLEKNESTGGIAATEALIPGFRFNTGFSDISRVDPAIIRDLALETHGLKRIKPETALYAAAPGGGQAIAATGRFLGDTESAAFDHFLASLNRMAAVIAGMLPLDAPNIKEKIAPGDALPWAGLALRVRRMGGREMMMLLRALPMSVRDFLEEQLPDTPVRNALALLATEAAQLGPYSAGSLLNLFYVLSGGISPVYAAGGAGSLSMALAQSLESLGGEVRTGAGVRQVLITDGAASGVELENGETIPASMVLSSADPGRTLLGLVPAGLLPVRFRRRLSAIRYRGTTATVHFALDRLPDFGVEAARLDARICIAESIESIERAFDDSKYGRSAVTPALIAQIPSLLDPSLAEPGKHTLSAIVRYVPYRNDPDAYNGLAERVIDRLSWAAPDFRETILETRVITPADYAQRYGLPEGAWNHGQMSLDQLLIMRPVPGWSAYRTPVDGLWLCGSGSHPGGGITCAPGRNAAKTILQSA